MNAGRTRHEGAEAAERFFRQALRASHTVPPRVITVDKNAAYPKAVAEMKWDKQLWRFSKLRRVKYLKNHRGRRFCLRPEKRLAL